MKLEDNIRFGRMLHDSGNIGDFAQIIGLEQVYNKMNVSPDIDINGWTGKIDSTVVNKNSAIILPAVGLVTCDKIGITEPSYKSPQIMPVFLGVAFSDMFAAYDFSHWLDDTQGLPILCRDQNSANYLSKLGYNGVFWGCSSLLIKKRKKEPENGKIYTCDLDSVSSITNYIPESIKKEMIELEGQQLPGDLLKTLTWEERACVQYEKMKERLQVLQDTARLVITSRIHLALPCIAMGIPVIKVSGQREQRLQLIDAFIKSYRASEFGEIDWNPSAPDIEDAKQQMLDIACSVVKSAYDRVLENAKIKYHSSVLQRNCFKKLTKHYSTPAYRGYSYPMNNASFSDFKRQQFFKHLTGKYPQDTDLVFYGAGINGMHLLHCLKNLIDACKSFAFVDSDSEKHGSVIGGYPIKSPNCLKEYNKDNLTVFVTPFGYCGGVAEAIAEFLINDFKMQEGRHFFIYELIMYSALQECFGYPSANVVQIASDISLLAWEFQQNKTGSEI